MPESDKLLAISRFFGVSLDYLMKEEIEVLLKTEECDCESVTERSVTEDHEQEERSQKEVEVQRGNTRESAKSTTFLGCIICITGILGLLIWGLITVFNPTASSQISESSAIHIDGNGIFLSLCVITIVLGAGFLLKKPGNGDKNEKNK